MQQLFADQRNAPGNPAACSATCLARVCIANHLNGRSIRVFLTVWQRRCHTAAATAAGYKAIDLEIKSTARQITITVANSKLNAGLPAGRSNEASKIIQGLEKSIAGRARAGPVLMMHLDY